MKALSFPLLSIALIDQNSPQPTHNWHIPILPTTSASIWTRLSPWRQRYYIPPKHWGIQPAHGAVTDKEVLIARLQRGFPNKLKLQNKNTYLLYHTNMPLDISMAQLSWQRFQSSGMWRRCENVGSYNKFTAFKGNQLGLTWFLVAVPEAQCLSLNLSRNAWSFIPSSLGNSTTFRHQTPTF